MFNFLKNNRNKLSSIVIAICALGLMGVSMPGCPGQQAMQAQIDLNTTKAADADRKIQALSNQVASLNKDITDLRGSLAQVAQTVIDQNDALKKMEEAIQAMSASKAKAAPKAAVKKKK
jgi:septal ring factor EnvC (AmiA/AmiB activator)